MDIIIKTGKDFSGEFILASKLTVDRDCVTVYAENLKARLPYEHGTLKIDIIPYTGGFLRICADNVMTGETESVLGVDSRDGGKLVVEYSRHTLFRVEAYSLITIEELPKDK
jgi:hypothetical protein